MGDLQFQFKGLTWANVSAAIAAFVAAVTAWRKFWPSRQVRRREEQELKEKTERQAQIDRERQLIELETYRAMREKMRDDNNKESKPRRRKTEPPAG